jgi:hypothetical protein
MLGRYASLNTYEDQGTQTQVTYAEGEEPSPPDEVHFATVFSRPGQLALDIRKRDAALGESRVMLWTGDGAVRGWRSAYGTAEQEDFTSLGDAVAAYTGISEAVAWEVPAQLVGLGYAEQAHAAFVAKLAFIGEDVVDGARCYVLRGKEAEDEVRYWIDEQDLVIRKEVTHWHVGGLVNSGTLPSGILNQVKGQAPRIYEATTIYHPVLNRPVDPTRFRLTPPVDSPPSPSVHGTNSPP